MILIGDCVEVLRGLDDASIDAIVTDPPYGLGDTSPEKVAACLASWLAGRAHEARGAGFMGRAWDAWVPGPQVWRECLRVLKPGGHLLAFAGSRTVDLMGLALRLAGFEVRDCLQWLYGSGFPKSLDVSKAMDKSAGVAPVGEREPTLGMANNPQWNALHRQLVMPPATTDAARRWQGWGTALKPAAEPILLCRKPIDGTVAANVLEHGTGALNIEACRVGSDDELVRPVIVSESPGLEGGPLGAGVQVEPGGRWPPNVVLSHAHGCRGDYNGEGCLQGCPVGLVGTAARFFPSFRYLKKPGGAEKNAGVTSEARTQDPSRDPSSAGANNPRNRGGLERTNHHPTVKPVELMRWLLRLVTPRGGTALDPFMGSGTTGCAAALEGIAFIGVEREPEYAELARQRIEWWTEHGEAAVAVAAAQEKRAAAAKSGQLGFEL